MDRSNDDDDAAAATAAMDNEPFRENLGSAANPTAPLPGPHMRKPRRMPGSRSDGARPLQGLGLSGGQWADAVPAGQDEFGGGAKARKGSLRNAVRKMFGGKRSRDVVSQTPDPYAPSSAYRRTFYQSSSAGLPPPREDAAAAVADEVFVGRELAIPYGVQQPPPPPVRTPSAYAVQFPKSVRLKPMDLGNPFIGPSSPQHRRRRSLPSRAADDEQEAEPADDSAARALDFERPRDPPASVPPNVLRQLKQDRRKSRSTEDLGRTSRTDARPTRKRSEEIRYWRESVRPDVLRASGFVARTSSDNDTVAEFPPGDTIAGAAHATPPPAPRHAPSLSVGDTALSGVGTDMSRDLEDRVAKLEAGLQSFQRSLQRLTAERNRRTIVMGSTTTRQSAADARTPSFLADTLADPMEPSSYSYQYDSAAQRPSTSPAPPIEQVIPPALPSPIQSQVPSARMQETLDDPFGPVKRRPSTSRLTSETIRTPTAARPYSQYQRPVEPVQLPPGERSPDSFRTPLSLPSQPAAEAPSSASASASQAQSQPYTFNSLYQMLADERSARRRLENQLKSLRQEISDLHLQAASPPSFPFPTARNSYMLIGGSTKLRELLRETEDVGGGTGDGMSSFSPPQSPRTTPSSRQRDSGLYASASAAVQRIGSRFSASESDNNNNTTTGSSSLGTDDEQPQSQSAGASHPLTHRPSGLPELFPPRTTTTTTKTRTKTTSARSDDEGSMF